MLRLNERSWTLCRDMIERASDLRVAVLRDESGAQVIDCGVHTLGGLEAGRRMAEISLAGLGPVTLASGPDEVWGGPWVEVRSDMPVAACMASQYAGWELVGDRFVAMGSGPMRAARGRESLFDAIGLREKSEHVVGVLECGKLPPPEICLHVARECHVTPDNVVLLAAPTRSLAGAIQVVARSIETALHKLHELGFELSRVQSGFGRAPLPPLAADDLAAVGRTNDAILYAADVTLWVDADEQRLAEVGPRVPSSASHDYGAPFGEIFRKYGNDFYRIDPLLFSPANVTLISLRSGWCGRFGRTAADVLLRSWHP